MDVCETRCRVPEGKRETIIVVMTQNDIKVFSGDTLHSWIIFETVNGLYRVRLISSKCSSIFQHGRSVLDLFTFLSRCRPWLCRFILTNFIISTLYYRVKFLVSVLNIFPNISKNLFFWWERFLVKLPQDLIFVYLIKKELYLLKCKFLLVTNLFTQCKNTFEFWKGYPPSPSVSDRHKF